METLWIKIKAFAIWNVNGVARHKNFNPSISAVQNRFNRPAQSSKDGSVFSRPMRFCVELLYTWENASSPSGISSNKKIRLVDSNLKWNLKVTLYCSLFPRINKHLTLWRGGLENIILYNFQKLVISLFGGERERCAPIFLRCHTSSPPDPFHRLNLFQDPNSMTHEPLPMKYEPWLLVKVPVA